MRRLASVVLRGFLALAVFTAVATAVPADAGQSKDPVTFTRDIAPILQRSCQQCHRPDSVAPMSLITYEEVRPYARAIKLRTGLRNKPGVMPPWYIEKNVGIQHFKDDISLSDEEIAKIASWADNGAPRATRPTCRRRWSSRMPMPGRSGRPISSSRRRRSR